MLINAIVRSAVDLPCKFTAPYSVTTYCVSVRGSVAGPLNFGTMREILPCAAVEYAVRIDLPPFDNCAPRTKSKLPPLYTKLMAGHQFGIHLRLKSTSINALIDTTLSFNAITCGALTYDTGYASILELSLRKSYIA